MLKRRWAMLWLVCLLAAGCAAAERSPVGGDFDVEPAAGDSPGEGGAAVVGDEVRAVAPTTRVIEPEMTVSSSTTSPSQQRQPEGTATSVPPEYLLGFGRADPPDGVFVDISATRYRTCGVREDGGLECWGESFGEPPQGRFARVSVADSYEDLRYQDRPAPRGHGCAVRVEGSVACWGNNSAGQSDASDGRFVDVSVREEVSCALGVDGSATCWGDIDPRISHMAIEDGFVEVFAGQIPCALESSGDLRCWGQGTMDLMSEPPSGMFVDISMTNDYACAVEVGGALRCWTHRRSTSDVGYSYESAVAPEGEFVSVAVGSSHACALRRENGSAACWGTNSFGQVDPDHPEHRLARDAAYIEFGRLFWHRPTSSPLAGPYVQIDITQPGGWSASTCALDSKGTVTCWGQLTYEYSENESEIGSHWQQAAAGAFAKVAVGDVTGCGIRAEGTLSCWGLAYAQGAVVPSGSFVDIDASGDAMCAIRDDGALVCWHPERRQQLRFVAVDEHGVQVRPGDFKNVSVGSEVCVVRADGTAACLAGRGIIGAAPQGHEYTKIAAPQSSGGNQQACGIRHSGTIECWGLHDIGKPAASVGRLRQASVAVGYPRACGIRTDHSLACWRTVTNREIQVEAAIWPDPPKGKYLQVSGAAQLDITGAFTCGIRYDGTVHCWRWNSLEAPAPPTGTFAQLSVGYTHACAIRTEGTVSCWGSNFDDPWRASF